jgi:hypothetical protein
MFKVPDHGPIYEYKVPDHGGGSQKLKDLKGVVRVSSAGAA